MKKYIALTLSALIIISLLPIHTSAVDRDFTEASKIALELKDRGLFMGTDKGFELDRAPTRSEALVMLIRSLGKETDAKAYTGHNPFSDAVGYWAENYIVYAYNYGLTNGVSSTVFGAEDTVSSAMYLTFVLRALGYSDKNNADFSWKAPFTLAKSVGIIPASSDTDNFLRADVVLISCASLSALIKNGSETLAHKLGLSEIPFIAGTLAITVSDIDDLYGKLNWALSEFPVNIEVTPVGTLKDKNAAEMLDLCVECSSTYCSYISSSYYEGSNVLTLTPRYSEAALAYAFGTGWRDNADDDTQKLLNKAKSILNGLNIKSLSEKDAVKAIHDYLVLNTAYDNTQSLKNSYSAVGVLLDGTGVCDGYSYAFWLLCRLSGLDCIRVSGETKDGGHAWNKVKVNGTWHNVDVTWDDPVYYLNGKLTDTVRYDYYMVNDIVISKDHSWTQYTIMPIAE